MKKKLIILSILSIILSFMVGILVSNYLWLSLIGIILISIITLYFIQRLTLPLEELRRALEAIGKGDLSYRMESSKEDGFIDSFGEMLERLRGLLGKVMELSIILSSASRKWSESTSDLSSIIEQHAMATEDLVEENESIVASVDEAGETLQQIKQNYVGQGQETVTNQEEEMEDNLKAVSSLKDRISALNKQAGDITVITETINNIAQKTNLLALNASIEAARAGQDGRGFNVVADKIKDLAVNSSDSSEEIMEIIAEINESIEEIVVNVDRTEQGIGNQQNTVRRVSTFFDEIVESTEMIEDVLTEVDSLTHESFNKTEEINAGIQQQAGSVQYIADQADRMSEVAFDLQQELDKFEFIKLAYTPVEEGSALVAREILEKRLGIKVVLVSLSYAEMYDSVAQGVLDGMVSGWLPTTHKKYIEKYGNIIEDLGPNLEGAQIGLITPDYVEVSSISDLQEKASSFKERKIYAIEETAGVTIAAKEALKEYELEDWSVEVIGLDNVIAKLRSASEKKQAVVATGWKPHWMFKEFPIKFLEDSRKVFGRTDAIHTIVRDGLREDNPEVYEILNRIYFEMEEFIEIMLLIKESSDPKKTAANFVRQNWNNRA